MCHIFLLFPNYRQKVGGGGERAGSGEGPPRKKNTKAKKVHLAVEMQVFERREYKFLFSVRVRPA